MLSKALHSSKSDEWYTPEHIYNELDAEFSFNLDPCATKENHKCAFYYTKEEDGLAHSWGGKEFSAIHLIARYRSG